MSELLSDNEVINRVFEHIDNETTDLGEGTWRDQYVTTRAPIALMLRSNSCGGYR